MDEYMRMLESKIVENNANQIAELLKKKNLIITSVPDNSVDPNRMYSTAEVCERLKVERHTVYELIKSGELKGKKKKSWKVSHASLAAYIKGS